MFQHLLPFFIISGFTAGTIFGSISTATYLHYREAKPCKRLDSEYPVNVGNY
jgi:hypothetical protein